MVRGPMREMASVRGTFSRRESDGASSDEDEDESVEALGTASMAALLLVLLLLLEEGSPTSLIRGARSRDWSASRTAAERACGCEPEAVEFKGSGSGSKS